jgi:hypothetical protein
MILFPYFVRQGARYSRRGTVSEIWTVAQLKAKAQLKPNLYVVPSDVSALESTHHPKIHLLAV